MARKGINSIILDNDGVLRREGEQLPGVPELYRAMTVQDVRNVLLSNNSRVTSDGLIDQLRKFGVENVKAEQAMTSAEGTAAWLKEHPSAEEMRVCVVGEQGVVTALGNQGIRIVNDEWDGKRWRTFPTDVVCGFDTKLDYEKLRKAWNAIREGDARFIGTNGDISYRGPGGAELPANGAALAYLSTAGKQPDAVIGKPEIGMAEAALHRMGRTKEDARIAVIGDNRVEDVGLAENLRAAGWDAEAWVVLTGVLKREQCEDPAIQRVFDDIRSVTRALSEME
jgi:HAD superfamily hydrolase (TIGR01450 family)